MGLVPGFVFSTNRRALLAVLAVGISVSYALVAGAAVGGLEEAQTALAGQLSDTDLVATDPDGEAFDPDELDPTPGTALARARTPDATVYAVRRGEPVVHNASRALASPRGPWTPGETVAVAGENRTVVGAEPAPGAGPGWLGVTEQVLLAAGGPGEGAHVAVYDDVSASLASRLEDQGLEVHEAPATFPYYTRGSLQLVSAVSVTVVASALVVALLTSTVVSLELRAKRASFATLQVYAGGGLVRRLVAGRGLALLTAGHAVGVGLTAGLLFLLERGGAAQLSLPTGFLATALAATFGGGLLGLAVPAWRASGRLEASDLGEAERPRDLPSPLRLTLASWRTLVPLAISAMILAGSLGVVFGAVDMPRQLFGSDDANVIADTDGNPLRGRAPAFLGTHLGAVDGFRASSPEIFAPTVVDDRPAMVRGVSWANLRSMDPVSLERGKPPDQPGEAVLGERLAGNLDAGLGDALTLPAPYSSSVETVRVVGVASAPRLLGDEMLVGLDTARDLTGLGPDQVHLVRYRAEPGLTPNGTQAPSLPTGLEATDLTLRPERPIPLETATARVELVNFANGERRRHLTLTVDDKPVADRFVEVPGHATATVEMDFRVPREGLFALEVNPSRAVRTDDPAYELDLPVVVANGTSFEATVTRASDGGPASDVRVSLGSRSARTDGDGTARLPAVGVGNRTVVAEGPEGRGADTLVVVEPGDRHRSRLLYREIHGPDSVDVGEPWPGRALVENVGGEAHQRVARIPVDGEPRTASPINLLSGERGRLEFELSLEEGTHRIGTGPAAVTVTVGSGTGGEPDNATDGGDAGGDADDGQDGTDADGSPSDPGDGADGTDADGGGTGAGGSDAGGDGDDGIRELLRRRARRGQSGETGTEEVDALDAFLADTFENFDAAVTVVTIATVLHAGLIGVVAVRRDVEEHADNLATMATVGADRRLLRRRALAEFGLVGALATAAGVAAGLGLVQFAAGRGWIAGFGHALVPRTGPGFALRVAVVSMLVVLASVVLAVEQVRGRSLGDLLAEGPRRSARPPLSKLIGGSG